MSQWAATEMPRWRRALLAGMQGTPDVYRQWPAALREADLYWVSRDMSMVAYDATEHVAPFVPAAVLPSPTGLLVWNASLPPVPMDRKTMREWRGIQPVTAGVMWAQRDGRVDLFLLARTDAVADQWRHLDPTFTPHRDNAVMPVTEITLGAADHTVDLAAGGLEPGVRDVVGLVALTWELMAQPTVSTPRQVTGAGGSSRDYTRRNRQVTIVDLRRMRHVAEDRDPCSGRVYTHRWLVGAFPRNQRYGPGLALTKRIWVAPHIKGPDGAPLIRRERVHVWR